MDRLLLRLLLLLLLLFTATAGCAPRRKVEEPKPFAPRPVDRHLTVAIDMSDSFRGLIERDVRAFVHLLNAVNEFFASGVGEDRNDRLLLVQISAVGLPILFEGTPREFHERFGSPDGLRRELLAKSDPRASRVYDSVSDAVEYALGADGVQPGKTRLALLCLSDMENNVTAPQTESRFARALADWAGAGGVVGLHWLPQGKLGPWRDYLRRVGFAAGRTCVSPDFIGSAPLPHL